MSPPHHRDPIFPLSGGSDPRPSLRPPRLTALVAPAPEIAFGAESLHRSWAEHRERGAASSATRTILPTTS